MSRILVTVVLLKPFWKAARDFLLTLFQPKRDSLSALNIYMLLFKGLPDSTLVCTISQTSVYVLSLAGFLRFNEACNVKWCDIDFKGTYFSLYIPRSKTDQYGSGSTRVVARTGNPTCPFNMLCRYAQLSGDSGNSTEFVSCSLSKGKNGNYSLRAGSKLSYSRARKLL